MMNKIFPLLCLLLFVSCSTVQLPKYEVSPVENEEDKLFWVQGRPYLTVEDEKFIFKVAAKDKYEPNVYSVSVENKTKKNVVVSHENFYLITSLNNVKVSTIPPTDLMKEYDVAYQEELINNQRLKTSDALVSLSTGLSSLSGSKSESTVAVENTENISRDAEIIKSNQELESIRVKQKTLRVLLLQKTTLLPGQSIEGEIHFRAARQNETRTIIFENNGSSLTADFAVVEMQANNLN